MAEVNARQALIDAYYSLEDTIGMYERGRTNITEVRRRHAIYRRSCTDVGEAHFCLSDITHDDMPSIPQGYPEQPPPADLPRVQDYVYDTPIYRKYVTWREAELLKRFGDGTVTDILSP